MLVLLFLFLLFVLIIVFIVFVVIVVIFDIITSCFPHEHSKSCFCILITSAIRVHINLIFEPSFVIFSENMLLLCTKNQHFVMPNQESMGQFFWKKFVISKNFIMQTFGMQKYEYCCAFRNNSHSELTLISMSSLSLSHSLSLLFFFLKLLE